MKVHPTDNWRTRTFLTEAPTEISMHRWWCWPKKRQIWFWVILRFLRKTLSFIAQIRVNGFA